MVAGPGRQLRVGRGQQRFEFSTAFDGLYKGRAIRRPRRATKLFGTSKKNNSVVIMLTTKTSKISQRPATARQRLKDKVHVPTIDNEPATYSTTEVIS